MKKIVATFVILQLVISGCSLFKKDPQEAVNEGLATFADVKKMSSSLLFSGTVQAPPGEKPQKIQFALDVTGKTDVSDDQSPKVDMKMKLNVSFDNQGGSAEFSIRSIDKKLYINLENIEIQSTDGADLQTQLAAVLKQWWILPSAEGTPFGQLTEEQKKLQNQFKKMNFFAHAVSEGEEEIHGVKSTRYRVDIDKDALKKFIVEIGRLEDNEVTPQEEAAIAESLKDVEWSGAVWIGDDDMLHRVKGTVTLQPSQGSNVSFDVDYQAWDYGANVAITPPKSAKELSPAVFFSLISAFSSIGEEEEPVPALPEEGEQVIPSH